MADNITLNAGSGGANLATASLTFSGDTAGVQVVGCGILSGSEGSWTLSQFVGGAGTVAAGVQRVTLASDDPAVAKLGTIDADTGAIKTAVELIDDAVYADDADWTNDTSKHLLVGGLYQSSPQTITDGDVGPFQVTANGYLVVSVNGTVTVGSHAVTNAGAFAVQVTGDALTALQKIDDPVSGSEMLIAGGATQTNDVKVTLDSEAVVLGTGSAAIGKLAANSGVDIGDVDVTSVVPGTAATNLGKARGSALGATDTGIAPLSVRNDDLADLAGADGDYTPVQVDNRGAVYVNQAAAEPKQASGVAAGGTPGTDNMIAAVAGKKLLILALSLFATSATTNTVYVNNVDNDLLGNSGNGIALSLDADGDTVAGFVLPYNPGGWFKTDAVNEAVTLNTSAAQDIIWCITYIETD